MENFEEEFLAHGPSSNCVYAVACERYAIQEVLAAVLLSGKHEAIVTLSAGFVDGHAARAFFFAAFKAACKLRSQLVNAQLRLLLEFQLLGSTLCSSGFDSASSSSGVR